MSVPRTRRQATAALRATGPGRLALDARRRYATRPAAQDRARAKARAEWIERGRPLPAPFPVKVDELLLVLDRVGPRVFIETGTFHGDTLRVLKEHVDAAWSIELSPELAARNRVSFARDPHVQIVEGDSGACLPRILDEVREPVLFWLDGHWSMGETARGTSDTPIRAELEAILTHNVDRHAVLIDDARLFGTGDYPSIADIEAQVRRHRPTWTVTVDIDIIRALPPTT